MLQVYLVRHGRTQWSAERRIQGQSDSPLTTRSEQQMMQVVTRAKELSITHIISSNLECIRRTAEIITQTCDCDVIFDFRLCELDMGVLEKRYIDSLTKEKENWHRQLVNDTVNERIPESESMQKLSDRANVTLESCRDLSQESRPPLMSHGIALGCLMSMILGLPTWAECRLRLCSYSISRTDYQESL